MKSDVAYALMLSNRLDEADTEYAAAMSAYRDVGGASSPGTIAILSNQNVATALRLRADALS